MRAARGPLAAGAAGLLVLLTGCVGFDRDVEEDPGTIAPRPPAAIELADLTDALSQDDVPATTVVTPDGRLSVSGDDLEAERDYWTSVGGRPEECRDLVAGPYLVGSGDVGGRLDDPSALLATVTELDEDRFGLMQVYARQFDDTATAASFLDEFQDAVAGCGGYRFVDGDSVTWDAIRLGVEPLVGAPEGVTALHYSETLRDSSALEASTTFLQRENIVISVFAEITETSTMTTADAVRFAAAIAARLSRL